MAKVFLSLEISVKSASSKDNINKLNSNGETLLHMVMKTDNPNAIQLCIKMGSNINAINNLGETPIYNAIRSNIYYNVLICLNNHTNLNHKNKKEEIKWNILVWFNIPIY